ncbi:MAG: endonuclease domain-containing protein [Bacteroidota bacterium]
MADFERWNNLPRSKALRRRLRVQVTTAEATLWQLLRLRRAGGLKFRRQHGIGPYIVDFYCPKARVAVEVDGRVHDDPARAESDAARQRAIESLGIQVLRFSNEEVLGQGDLVAQAIVRACASALPK